MISKVKILILAVSLALLVLGISISSFCLIALSTASDGYPAYFKDKATAVVVSESMLPTLKVGDHVMIERLDKTDELSVGDVYVYAKDDILVIHRLVAEYYSEDTQETLYVFKGDNNDYCDIPVKKESIIAKAIGVT